MSGVCSPDIKRRQDEKLQEKIAKTSFGATVSGDQTPDTAEILKCPYHAKNGLLIYLQIEQPTSSIQGIIDHWRQRNHN